MKRPRAVKEALLPEKADRRLKVCGARNNTPTDDVNVYPFSIFSIFLIAIFQAIRRLKGTGRQLDALMKDEPIDFLKGRKIGEAIADLEKKLQEKHTGGASSSNNNNNRNAPPTTPGRENQGIADAKKKIEDAIGIQHIFL